MVLVFFVFFTLLAMPAYFIYALWRKPEANRFHWLTKSLYVAAFMAFIFIVGPWDWASYYLRYVWLALFAVALAVSYRAARHQPFVVQGGLRTWSDLFTLAVFLGLALFSAKGFLYSGAPVHLAFPLEDGRYYVGQGGNSPLVNYHNTYGPQQYALDIVALNALGTRASGIYPSDLSRYAIFGKRLSSPCDGTVTKAVDGLPDQVPPSGDRENPPGNHVVISCQGVNVVLAHLRQGSVAVQAGDVVSVGQTIGEVGNSGNTSEPHLHIHAVRADAPDAIVGEGVPILFDGRFAVRNSVFVR